MLSGETRFIKRAFQPHVLGRCFGFSSFKGSAEEDAMLFVLYE